MFLNKAEEGETEGGVWKGEWKGELTKEEEKNNGSFGGKPSFVCSLRLSLRRSFVSSEAMLRPLAIPLMLRHRLQTFEEWRMWSKEASPFPPTDLTISSSFPFSLFFSPLWPQTAGSLITVSAWSSLRYAMAASTSRKRHKDPDNANFYIPTFTYLRMRPDVSLHPLVFSLSLSLYGAPPLCPPHSNGPAYTRLARLVYARAPPLIVWRIPQSN
jgi:hypothetical protein